MFEEVVAQKHITTTLKNAISSGRIAHAFLFSGPRGIGKTTVTRILAKALNCEHGPTPTPCNQCGFCKAITEGSSLDVLEIDGASNRGIDEVRDLREATRYAPTEGRYKIYIIDEVHMLTPEAFNALLKTLEEPPRNVVFVFATTQPQKVPATILSRCQRFDFRRIPTNDIVEHLALVSRKDELQIDRPALLQIAKRAEGSMRDALSLLDQVASFGGDRITPEVVGDVLGLIDQEALFDACDAIAAKDAKKALRVVGHIIDSGGDIKEFLGETIEYLRQALLLKISGNEDAEAIGVSEDYLDRCGRLSKHLAEEDLLRMIGILSDLEFAIDRAAQPRLRLEVAIVRMAKLDSSVAVTELLGKLAEWQENPALKSRPSIRPPEPENPAESASQEDPALARSEPQKETGKRTVRPQKASQRDTNPAESISPQNLPGTLETVKGHWQTVVDKVKQRRVSLGALLSQGAPKQVKDRVLTLSFRPDNGFHIGEIRRHSRLVEQIVADTFQGLSRIECVLEQANGASGDELLAFLCSREPIIKAVLDKFDGELVLR